MRYVLENCLPTAPHSGGNRTSHRSDAFSASIGFGLTAAWAAASWRRHFRRHLTSAQRNPLWGSRCSPSGHSVPGLTRNRRAAARSRACGYGIATGHPVWLNRDPIFESGGINLYGFVGNNPMMFVDPYGEAWYDWGWIDTAADWGAGLGDALSLNATRHGRNLFGLDENVNPCSTAYAVGGATSFALGVGRLGYAVAAKGVSVVAQSAAQASRVRAALTGAGRLGAGRGWRPPNVSRYKTQADLRAAAGRTNPNMNAYGAAVASTAASDRIGDGCD
jgi:hypothetical protein